MYGTLRCVIVRVGGTRFHSEKRNKKRCIWQKDQTGVSEERKTMRSSLVVWRESASSDSLCWSFLRALPAVSTGPATDLEGSFERSQKRPEKGQKDNAGNKGKERYEIAMRTKLQLLLFALLLVSLLVDVSAQQRRKKHRRRTTTTEATVQDEVMNMLEADEIAEAAEDAEVTVEDGRNEVGSKPQSLLRMDPCMDKHCGAGRVCKAIDEDTAECVCVEVCDEEVDPRRKVCTNHNETFGSDCEVYQARCFCDSGDARCRNAEKYQHVHVVYFGECREMPECKKEDMADFPRRMRDWLFNIMRDLADRQELPSHYLKMQREAETNHTLRWTNAAIWKWCDLDGHPHDRAVSRHELFPIKAPLMALEHCIAPFLDSCDRDNDHKITLIEWGKCLELNEEDLEDKCDELAETKKSEQY